jgi:hypothetical protein
MEVASVTKMPISASVEPVSGKSSFSDCLSSYLTQDQNEKNPVRSRTSIKPVEKRKPESLVAGEAYRPGVLARHRSLRRE